jgi:arylformamidase
MTMLNLSYKLSENTPFYEGLAKPSVEQIYDLGKGDACNSFYFTSSNHAGTHVDGPFHFNPAGRKIADYEPDELVFTRPAILDTPLAPSQLIAPEALAGLDAVRPDCDLLLLRSGFGARRGDAKTYVEQGPGFSTAAARHILDRLPSLRAVAMDFISAAAMAHMEEGCEAHRVFLGCAGYSDRAVLLIEDARLPADLPVPSRVIVAPWLFEGLDSAPCSLLAEFDEGAQQ